MSLSIEKLGLFRVRYLKQRKRERVGVSGCGCVHTSKHTEKGMCVYAYTCLFVCAGWNSSVSSVLGLLPCVMQRCEFDPPLSL